MVAYTVSHQNGRSHSFPRTIELPAKAVVAIEYAIWWDWDIQHLYELEHIWVYLDDNEQVVQVEASWHGSFHVMVDAQGNPPLEDGRVILYAEPGKHAFTASSRELHHRAPTIRRHCGTLAGVMGLHVTPLFRRQLLGQRNPLVNYFIYNYLQQCAFQPTFQFKQLIDLSDLEPVPWPVLEAWIPVRIAWWIKRLHTAEIPIRQQNRQLAGPSQDATVDSTTRAQNHPALWPVWHPLLVVMREAVWLLTALLIGLYLEFRRIVWVICQVFSNRDHADRSAEVLDAWFLEGKDATLSTEALNRSLIVEHIPLELFE